MRTYELYGLRVRSELLLDAPASRASQVDMKVSWGEELGILLSPPLGRTLADAALGRGQGYAHTQTESGYTLRFHAVCDLRVDQDRRRMTVHLVPGADPRMAALLVGGNAMAFLLTLAGECVLHASAVSLGGGALAFVGAPGMGKSTLAALCCAEGARLVTDDVLRLAQDGIAFRCFPGSTHLRLRTGAADLAARFPGGQAEPTVDGRVAVSARADRSAMPRLRAIVIPYPSRDLLALRLERVAGYRAVMALARHPRVLGLREPELLRSQFHAFARVAQSVPVYEGWIPWGPPFDPHLVHELLAGVGMRAATEVAV